MHLQRAPLCIRRRRLATALLPVKYIDSSMTSVAGDRVKIDENRETFEAILNVIRGTPLPLTFDTRAGDCWNTYR